MFKKLYLKTKFIALLMISVFLLAACEDKNIVLTTEFGENEIMRINYLSCDLPEMMLYLTTVQNQYEQLYGEELWDKNINGESVSERIKETVLAQVAQIKVMNLMADDYKLELSEEENAIVNEKAQSYFDSLNDKEIEMTGATLKTVQEIYKEYALANKVYNYIIRDVNPEISDDEARRVTVQHILIKTYAEDSNGNRVEYTVRARQEAKDLANDIWKRATDEENPEDFESLAAEYNEDDTMTYTFGRGETAAAFEEAAFNLDKGAISEVIQTESGFHIIKCINTYDVEETQKNKLKILQARQDEVFEQTYDEYVQGIKKNLNHELFEAIQLIEDPEVNTSDLFDVDF